MERGHGSGEQSARVGQTIEYDKEVLIGGNGDESHDGIQRVEQPAVTVRPGGLHGSREDVRADAGHDKADRSEGVAEDGSRRLQGVQDSCGQGRDKGKKDRRCQELPTLLLEEGDTTGVGKRWRDEGDKQGIKI